jgi:hypothetical protein
MSQSTNISIVAAILTAYNIEAACLNVEQQEMAQEYYQLLLAIRDRNQGIDALIKQEPDLMSDLVREGIQAMQPMLQVLHDNKFDMGQAVKLNKAFTGDLLKTAKVRKNYTPSIEDFVALLRRQLPPTWSMLHDASKRCPEMSADIKAFLRNTLNQFRVEASTTQISAVGPLERPLLEIFDALSPEDQQEVRGALDSHAAYLLLSQQTSHKQLQQILDGNAKTSLGPGLIIPRWESLMDSTLISPATLTGPIRRGREVKLDRIYRSEQSETGAFRGKDLADIDVNIDVAAGVMKCLVKAPDVSVVVDTLSRPFKSYLQNRKVSKS